MTEKMNPGRQKTPKAAITEMAGDINNRRTMTRMIAQPHRTIVSREKKTRIAEVAELMKEVYWHVGEQRRDPPRDSRKMRGLGAGQSVRLEKELLGIRHDAIDEKDTWQIDAGNRRGEDDFGPS
jgi:hypothetical protein